MNIRQASVQDLAELNRIMHARSAYDGGYQAILEGYRIAESQLAKDLIFLAMEDQGIVGFYSLIKEPPELDLFFVADEVQNSGYGRQLFNHLVATAVKQGIKQLKIVSHPPALDFYKKMGARHVGRQKPLGRITWSRPILKLEIGLTDASS